MYDHGFMDNTNRQAVKNWLDSQTRDASLTSWRQPWSYIWLEFGLFSTIIAIIRACACWALFVVTLTNTVHFIYIYIYIYIHTHIDIHVRLYYSQDDISNVPPVCDVYWIWCALFCRFYCTYFVLSIFCDFILSYCCGHCTFVFVRNEKMFNQASNQSIKLEWWIWYHHQRCLHFCF